jgi:hypothetical protein
MFKVFHASFALISGLKDEPYDDIIIVSFVFFVVGTARYEVFCLTQCLLILFLFFSLPY